jgi:thiol:disulfide interchange protein DsbG
MPVGLLSRASAPQGATIIGAADPVKAMGENEQSIADQGNGITANGDAVSRLASKVDANTEIFLKARSQDDGVPFIVAKVGNDVRFKSGALPTDQLKTFLGLPN